MGIGTRLLVVVLSLSALASTHARAATINVPADFAAIQPALDAAAAGDVIVVAPGVYTGSIAFHAKDVALESVGGPDVTVLRGSGGAAVDIGPGGRIAGFTITFGTGTSGGALAAHGSGTEIVGNIFDRNVQPAGGYGAAIGGNNASPLVDRNVFRENHCDTQFVAGTVVFVNTSFPLITNNIFEDNVCRAITLVLPVGNAPRVINNTIVGNTVGIRIWRQGDTFAQIYRNNVIVGNDVGVEAYSGNESLNPTWEHNLVFGNDVDWLNIADQTGSNGNIAADPAFVDALTGDYRLQAGSPAIDTGLSDIDTPVIDFDGSTRPLDGDGDGVAAVDVGAFESTTPPTASPTTTPIATPTSTPTETPLPTVTPTPTRPGDCPPAPLAACDAPERSTFTSKHRVDAQHDVLGWRFINGATPRTVADLGDPETTAIFSLCVYDGTTLIGQSLVPPDALRWTLRGRALVYADSTASADGIRKLRMKAGLSDAARPVTIDASGKGARLPVLRPPFSSPIQVTVQLVISPNGPCFSDSYTSAASQLKFAIGADGSSQFVAKNQ